VGEEATAAIRILFTYGLVGRGGDAIQVQEMSEPLPWRTKWSL
jgi:hypothetical protein